MEGHAELRHMTAVHMSKAYEKYFLYEQSEVVP